jgi:hypothetical protein
LSVKLFANESPDSAPSLAMAILFRLAMACISTNACCASLMPFRFELIVSRMSALRRPFS